jgi:hypothetical protein
MVPMARSYGDRRYLSPSDMSASIGISLCGAFV